MTRRGGVDRSPAYPVSHSPFDIGCAPSQEGKGHDQGTVVYFMPAVISATVSSVMGVTPRNTF